MTRLLDRLPARLAAPVRRLSASFAEGINWPRGGRGVAVVFGSIAIELLALTQFLWAGLAFGVTLKPAQYLFIMVFIGSLVILGHFARVAGSFIIGALFVLSLLGVPEEQALAMVLVVEAANLLSVAGIGALALWSQGVAISDVRAEAMMRGVKSRLVRWSYHAEIRRAIFSLCVEPVPTPALFIPERRRGIHRLTGSKTARSPIARSAGTAAKGDWS